MSYGSCDLWTVSYEEEENLVKVTIENQEYEFYFAGRLPILYSWQDQTRLDPFDEDYEINGDVDITDYGFHNLKTDEWFNLYNSKTKEKAKELWCKLGEEKQKELTDNFQNKLIELWENNQLDVEELEDDYPEDYQDEPEYDDFD